jgi:hypothetical protein
MRVIESETPKTDRLDLLFEAACQETCEFAHANTEYGQVWKSAVLIPVRVLEDANESFDEVCTPDMSETAIEENVDCCHSACKKLRPLRIEPVISPELVTIQSVRQPMARQPKCRFPTCVNIEDCTLVFETSFSWLARPMPITII